LRPMELDSLSSSQIARAPAVSPICGILRNWSGGSARVAIAIDEGAISIAELAAVSEDALPDLVLSLQPGIRYLEAGWPVDELMKLYLAETAPESLVFEPVSVWLEIRGARGEFSAARLDWCDFVFRQAISHGQSIGEAVECALGRDAAFDPGAALAGLFAAGMVTAIAGRGCQ
jgi:hypothetical protein